MTTTSLTWKTLPAIVIVIHIEDKQYSIENALHP